MINIKLKYINILIAALAFVATSFIVSGVDAGVDENTIYTLANLDEYERNIKDLQIAVDDLKNQVEHEKGNLSKYENDSFLENIISINAQIEQLKLINGFTDVRGPGIMMSVSDSTIEDDSIDIMQKIVHDVDITVLLNDLKNAGAEAIDVNSQRIINISEVVCAGPVLQINGEAVPAPFLIKVIGDMDSLYNAVTEEGTYAYELKNTYGMEVVVVKHYNQPIPSYKVKNYEMDFAKISE